MEPEYLAAVIGAVPGVLALGWNVKDARQKKAAAIYPPGLRKALMELDRLASGAQLRAQTREWMVEHIEPLDRELAQFANIVPTGTTAGAWLARQLQGFQITLGMLSIAGTDDHDDAARSARKDRQQDVHFKEASTKAQSILRRMPPEAT